MREQAIALLGQILQNNIGNRLTEEMATGIATTLNHHLMQVDAQPWGAASESAAFPPVGLDQADSGNNE